MPPVLKNQVLVTADPARNLLQFSFVGDVGPGEMALTAGLLENRLAGLAHGFRLLADLTELNSMDPACVPAIRANMDRVSRHGVTQVVRIIPDRRKDIGLNILSLFHYPPGLPIITCETRVEAENALR